MQPLGDASMLVYYRNPEPREGIPEGYVRTSVGFEDANDIIMDLDQALNRANSTTLGVISDDE